MRLKNRILIAVATVLIVVFLGYTGMAFSLVNALKSVPEIISWTTKMQKDLNDQSMETYSVEQFEYGEDAIPSVTNVLGFRKLTEIGANLIRDNLVAHTYSYLTETRDDDYDKYIDFLIEQGFTVLSSDNFSVSLTNKSVEKDKIVIIIMVITGSHEFTVNITNCESPSN